MEFLTRKEIQSAFAEYLRTCFKLSPADTARAVSGFPDPYSDPYLTRVYIGECDIGGELYEKYFNIVDLKAFRRSGAPAFRFYTCYRLKDIPGRTVKEYRAAVRLYVPYRSADSARECLSSCGGAGIRACPDRRE